MRAEVEPPECPVIENQHRESSFQGAITIIIIDRYHHPAPASWWSPSPSSWSSISTITTTIIIIILILPDRDSSLPRRLPSWPARSPSTRRNGFDDDDEDDDDDNHDDHVADVAGVQVRCQPAPKSWTACYLERSSNFYHWRWFQGAEIILLFIVFINHTTTTTIIIISTMIIL